MLLQAAEPHLAWHTYLDAVLRLCREFDVSSVITLGALLAEVSHTRPLTVTGSSTDDDLRRRLDVGEPRTGRYEGPTGIVGVLTEAVRAAGIPTASLWANVPVYLDASPNPKGALALLERLNGALGLDLTLHDLEVFCARFDAQVAAAVERDPTMSEYAQRIEEREAQDDADEAGPGRPAGE